jgi:replicative DNA helicase
MTTTDAYLPPQNLEAEESVLGAMMVSETAVTSVIVDVHLQGDDFYRQRHLIIFKAIHSLHSRGEPVDALTVTEQLTALGELTEAGGKEFVSGLASTVPVAGNAEHYARIVKANAMLRRLLQASQRIQKSVHDREGEPRDLVEQAERMMFEVAHDTQAQDFAAIADILERETTRLDELSRGVRDLTGTPSGFADIDKITGGFQPGNLIVIAARPAMGKCLAGSSLVFDPTTGVRRRIDELHSGGDGEEVWVSSLSDDTRLRQSRAAAVVASGVKPTFKLVTRLGRSVTASANHPLLTVGGWQRLDSLSPGDRVAVPRVLAADLNVGDDLPDHELVLLAALIADGDLTGSTPRFCFGPDSDSAVLPEVERACEALGVKTRCDGYGNASLSNGRGAKSNPATDLMREHGLMGSKSGHKFVPEAVFRCSEDAIARFLGILFACDGHIYNTERLSQAGYTTISERLAKDVQHLLLRLGIVSKIRKLKREVYEGTETVAREVRITGQSDLVAFCHRVPVPGKQARQADVIARVLATDQFTNVDTVPSEAWEFVLAAKGERPRNHNWHVGTRGLSRGLLGQLATEFTDPKLASLASSDIWWDEIVSIEPAGEQMTYDLQVPGDECFVADDILVHNSAFVGNIADFVAVEKKQPVAFFSLEMSETELAHRFLACRAGIQGDKLRKGQVKDQWTKILRASGQLAEAPIWIDTSSDLSTLELRAKARRLHSKEQANGGEGLGLIIVDYIQLMRPDDPRQSRVEQVGAVSRGLKLLAGELGVPVLGLSQLSRGPEGRPDKRPLLSDLRDSGAIEQDSDVVMFLFREEYYERDEGKKQDLKGLAEVLIAKHRNGPIGDVQLAFQDPYPRFRNMARGHNTATTPSAPRDEFEQFDSVGDEADEF